MVWQKSMVLVTNIYQISKTFPRDEIYGLTSQMRRCAISITSNLAEGYSRTSTNEFIHYLHISAGSLYELQTQMEIALNLNYLKKNDFNVFYEKTREIERMLSSLVRKLNDKKV